jgi:hypothetical protein
MNRRNQSGYDPVGDPRTGRPPLPEDRARRALPEENREGEAGDQSTLGRLASEGSEALRAAGDTVERGSEFSNTASRQLQSYSDELASFTRRRPIGALAGAVIFGILLGMMGRRRS